MTHGVFVPSGQSLNHNYLISNNVIIVIIKWGKNCLIEIFDIATLQEKNKCHAVTAKC